VEITNGIFLPQPRWSMGDAGGPRPPIHRPMVNLYVRPDAVLEQATVEGRRVDSPLPAVWENGRPPAHRELGVKAWPATMEIMPNKSASVTYAYRTPGVVETEGGRKVYRLIVQHQPKVRPERTTLSLRLPREARDVKARGWRRQGDALVWKGLLTKDMEMEVSWRR
jgi:hypothetical protein